MNKGVVALTGGTGFLGYHLVPALLKAGYGIRLLKRPGSAHPLVKDYPEGVELKDVDFESISSIQSACSNCAFLIHAAGLVSYDLKDQKRMHETHVVLTRRMLEAAQRAGVKKFVHVSSIVTIGHGIEPRDESSPFNAASLRLPYWTTKLEAEALALSLDSTDFTVVSVNPGSLLGRGEKNGQLLPFVKKLAATKSPFLPNGGSDFLDVEDAALGTVLALERGKGGERYILGSENLTYAQFHGRLRGVLGLPSKPRVVPGWALRAASGMLEAFETLSRIDLPVNSPRLRRVNGVFMFHDLTKARRELGYEPRAIDSALRAMLEEDCE